MKIKLRQARLNDLSALQELFVETIVSTCKKDYSDEQIKAWTSKVKNKDEWISRLSKQYFIAGLVDDKIVGFASLENGNYLDLLYVHKDFLRQGIASALYKVLKEESLRLGFDKLSSDVSVTALPFFKSKGFKVIKENKNLINGTEIINYNMVQ